MNTNNFHKNESRTYFQVADANWCMYNPNNFETIEAAREVIKKEYRERKKNDGYDKYWNEKALVILKKTVTIEVVELDDPTAHSLKTTGFNNGPYGFPHGYFD